MDKWDRCTRFALCPLCGKGGKCSILAEDSDCVMCANIDQAPAGWFIVKKCPNAEPPSIIYRKGEKKQRQQPLIPRLQRAFQNALPPHIDLLMEQLELPTEIIKKCQYGWCEKHNGKVVRAFTAPEKDSSGRIVGFSLRYPKSGTKKPMLLLPDRAKKTGLFWIGDMVHLPDPVLIVEGMSDVAACLMLGVAAVGRHSNTSGERDLIPLLRDRKVIVVGEMDSKTTGKWPGQMGAQRIASKLAQAWGGECLWAMTQDGAKDTREWINSRQHEPDLKELGLRLVAGLKEYSNTEKGLLSDLDEDRPMVANVVDSFDNESKYKPLVTSVTDIKNRLQTVAKGWPKRVNGMLFVANDDDMAEGEMPGKEAWRPLKSVAELFGWMHEISRPRWYEGACVDPDSGQYIDAVTKAEFFSSCGATLMPNFNTVEILPHYPKVEDAHYCNMVLPESDGTALKEFVDHLNPATPMDRDLLEALVLTMGWGGEPGARPGFVLTSDWGTGAGKTRTAELIAEMWGGCVTVGEKEEWDGVRSRLLSDSALQQRVVLIDNIKGRMSRSGLESAITGKVIDGKKLWFGQFQRPNYLTWVMTSNTPSLSKDLADRSIVIKIGEPKHADSAEFEAWASWFGKNRRAALIADVIAKLRKGPIREIDRGKRDRWGAWGDEILRTFENPNELLDFIRSGRMEVDQDLMDAEKVLEVIFTIMERMGLDIATGKMRISKIDFRQWLLDFSVIDNKFGGTGVTRWLERLRKLSPLQCFNESSSHGQTRKWTWIGLDSDADAPWHDYDFQTYGGAESNNPNLPQQVASGGGDGGGGGKTGGGGHDSSRRPDFDEDLI